MPEFSNQWCAAIPCKSAKEQEFCLAKLRAIAQRRKLWDKTEPESVAEPCRPCDFRECEDTTYVVVMDDDGMGLDAVAATVCAWQKVYGSKDPWFLAWARVCSRHQVDAFEGGMLLCLKGKAFWNDPEDQKKALLKKAKKLFKKRKKKHKKG